MTLTAIRLPAVRDIRATLEASGLCPTKVTRDRKGVFHVSFHDSAGRLADADFMALAVGVVIGGVRLTDVSEGRADHRLDEGTRRISVLVSFVFHEGGEGLGANDDPCGDCGNGWS